MTKEEYIKYVREYKVALHILVKFQRYLKRYLRKSTYPNAQFLLSKEQINEAVKILGLKWPERFYPEERSSGKQWAVEYMRGRLHNMQECRVYAKEEFKKSQESEKVA
jgi:hypothetical protein